MTTVSHAPAALTVLVGDTLQILTDADGNRTLARRLFNGFDWVTTEYVRVGIDDTWLAARLHEATHGEVADWKVLNSPFASSGPYEVTAALDEEGLVEFIKIVDDAPDRTIGSIDIGLTLTGVEALLVAIELKDGADTTAPVRIDAKDLSSAEIIERTQLLHEIGAACDAVDYSLCDNAALAQILAVLKTAVAR